MYRGQRPPNDPLPDGLRIDTRRHTRHCLRPPRDLVDSFLAAPSSQAWARFEHDYRAVLNDRFATDPRLFQDLAELAMDQDVYIGCSCPTAKNPDPQRCHTIIALHFMSEKFPQLHVQLPA